MDLSTTIDRKDYIKDDQSMEKHLLGGFSKLFKVQYQPLGFSWMIFADRNDFDRQHYDFRYVRREFLGDVRYPGVRRHAETKSAARAVSWAASGLRIRTTTSCA